MSKDNSTIRERLAVVETEVRYMKENVGNMATVMEEYKDSTDGRLNELNQSVIGLTSVVDNKLQGSFSGKEKAMIITAVIAGVVSVINTIVIFFKG